MNKFFLEIKNRLILIGITLFFTLATSYFYKEMILFNIFHKNVFFKNNKEQIEIVYFIFTNVIEILTVYLKLVIFLNFQVITVAFFYHGFVFIIPALFNLEYFYLQLIFKTISFTYLIFLTLFNYLILPIVLNFFLSFQETSMLCLHFEAKLLEYVNFYISFYYNGIFYCQFFTLIFLILNFINIKIKFIKKFRKLCYYFLLIIATFTSSPEIITQTIIFLIFFFFFESLVIFFLIKLNLKYNLASPIIKKNMFI